MICPVLNISGIVIRSNTKSRETISPNKKLFIFLKKMINFIYKKCIFLFLLPFPATPGSCIHQFQWVVISRISRYTRTIIAFILLNPKSTPFFFFFCGFCGFNTNGIRAFTRCASYVIHSGEKLTYKPQ